MFTIRREDLFEEEFNNISVHYNRIDELESAIDWYLCRGHSNEKYVSEVEGFSNHYLWKMGQINESFPQLLILYKVDQENEMIYLISVKEV